MPTAAQQNSRTTLFEQKFQTSSIVSRRTHGSCSPAHQWNAVFCCCCCCFHCYALRKTWAAGGARPPTPTEAGTTAARSPTASGSATGDRPPPGAMRDSDAPLPDGPTAAVSVSGYSRTPLLPGRKAKPSNAGPQFTAHIEACCSPLMLPFTSCVNRLFMQWSSVLFLVIATSSMFLLYRGKARPGPKFYQFKPQRLKIFEPNGDGTVDSHISYIEHLEFQLTSRDEVVGQPFRKN